MDRHLWDLMRQATSDQFRDWIALSALHALEQMAPRLRKHEQEWVVDIQEAYGKSNGTRPADRAEDAVDSLREPPDRLADFAYFLSLPMDLGFTRRVLTAADDIVEYVLAYRGREAANAQREWQVETLERIVSGELFF